MVRKKIKQPELDFSKKAPKEDDPPKKGRGSELSKKAKKEKKPKKPKAEKKAKQPKKFAEAKTLPKKKEPAEQKKLIATAEKGAKIISTSVEEEMKGAYIDYAMSVIVGRALPDVRDGFKPVHRRILFAMDELGLHPNKPYKKSARVVGEVLGKYHPHGDTAVYDSMVRMAQEFSLRYPLVDGQGNFGSVDGDSAAAMRYTEARLSPIAIQMLQDIEKDTVQFGPNFDDSLKEPLVLPSRFPNLIVNGSSGIAVGMATNMPPHNLSEVIDGIVEVIDKPEVSPEHLMKIVKGPDFPTGGIICGDSGIRDAYIGGRGLLTVRAKVSDETTKTGKDVIIIDELPYQINKAMLIEKIANLVKDKKITGIADLRDESDREGMRVYIELKHGASRDITLNQLYKFTDMQTTFGVNMVCLVGGEPKQVNLKGLVDEYIKHREEVVVRRTKFELKKAEHEAHILEGLRIAIENIDAIVKLIRKSKNPDEARSGLISKFKLTKVQAQAILDMRLQKLTQLERHKIEEEYKKLKKLIGELKAILASRKKVLDVIKKELAEIKEKFGDERRTQLEETAEVFEVEALIPKVEVAILITRDGYIKRMPVSAFRAQLRGGRGVAGMTTREEDQIENIFIASTHSFILFFTNRGRAFRVKVYELPEASRAGKGQSIANFLQVGQGEKVTAAVPVPDVEKKEFLVMATRNGIVKKTELSAFSNIRRSGIIAMTLKDGDDLNWVKESDGKREIILATERGMIIRFNEKDIRAMGRSAAGVKGVSLKKGDRVISMDVIKGSPDILTVSSAGFGKRMKADEFRGQKRGGKGMTAMKLRDKDKVAGMRLIMSDDELIFVTAKGTMSKQTADGISTQGRYAKGVRIQRLDKSDYVVDFARVIKEEKFQKDEK
jgi:DNA gyrase subunit A